MAARSTPDEVLPYLYVGSKWHVSPPVLKRYNIKWVLNLYNKKAEAPKGIEADHFLACPLSDHGDSSLKDNYSKCVEHISKAREKEENILIHCEGGINRAPTMTMTYLMVGEKYTLRDAMNLVKSKRKLTAPHLGYLTQLVEIENKEKGENSIEVEELVGIFQPPDVVMSGESKGITPEIWTKIHEGYEKGNIDQTIEKLTPFQKMVLLQMANKISKAASKE